MSPLRFGIIGCGGISWTHGEALTRLKHEGLTEIVAATDALTERAEAFTSQHGGTVEPTLEALLARPDVDAVTICTPSGLHGQMAAQAARTGKHILSEKPLDVWIDAVDNALAAAEAAGVIYGCIFQERFSPAALKVKRAIDAGAFGEIVLACAETKWYRSQEYYDSGEWRGTWSLDAGVFSNQGIHCLDKVQWLAGPVVQVLSATLLPGYHRAIEGETLGVVTLRFANGALGTLAMTTLSYEGFPERVDISGTKGSAILTGNDLTLFQTMEPFEPDSDTPTPPSGAVAPELGVGGRELEAGEQNRAADPLALTGEGHLGNIRDFVLAVREGREPLVSARSARQAVVLLNMIYEKAKVGQYA